MSNETEEQPTTPLLKGHDRAAVAIVGIAAFTALGIFSFVSGYDGTLRILAFGGIASITTAVLGTSISFLREVLRR